MKYAYQFIIILGLLIRIYGLNLNPVGITHDEVHDLINAKSIAVTGKSAPGTIAGIFTRENYVESNGVFGELVSYLLIPWMKFFPLSLFWSKIPFLLASLGIVYFGGKFFENISGKKNVGKLTSLIIAINPWAIHFGRSAYENLFTFCFYLMGLYFFTKNGKRFINLFFGLIFLILGFLSYMGAKPIFPFLLIWGISYNLYYNQFRRLKRSFYILMIGFIFFVSYLFVLQHSTAGSRLKEIQINQDAASETNKQRQISLEIPFFRDVFINKYSVYMNILTKKYLGIFSPVYLFNEGEGNFDIFIISNHSYMYLHEFPLLILGIAALGQTLPAFIFLAILIAIIPLPSVLSGIGVTYALRAGLMFPILCGICAWGILWFKSKIPLLASKIFLWCVVFFYICFFINFLVMYWYRTPFEKNVGWYFHERIVSKYIELSKLKSNNIVLISKNPLDFLYVYAFYGDRYNTSVEIKRFNEKIKNRSFQVDNVSVLQGCEKIKNIDDDTTYIIQQGIKCEIFPNRSIKIAEPRDSGEQFIIAQDHLCNNRKLTRYPYPRRIDEFDLENMSLETFCSTWITNPDQPI